MTLWHGFLGHRLDWWTGDANRTGAVLAIISILALTAALVRSDDRRLYFPALIAYALALIGIDLTASRGSLLGAIVGVCMVIGAIGRLAPHRRGTVAVSAAALAALIACAATHGRSSIGYISADRSVLHRTEQIAAFARMVHDAPEGWRDPGAAYTDFYRPASSLTPQHALVSGHLQTLATHATAGRIAYVFAWLVPLVAFILGARGHRFAVALRLFAAVFLSSVCMWSFNRLDVSPLLTAIALCSGAGVVTMSFMVSRTATLVAIAASLFAAIGIIQVVELAGSKRRTDRHLDPLGPPPRCAQPRCHHRRRQSRHPRPSMGSRAASGDDA